MTERTGVTGHGEAAMSPTDQQALEEVETAEDVLAYRAAKAADDGRRVSLHELRRDLSS